CSCPRFLAGGDASSDLRPTIPSRSDPAREPRRPRKQCSRHSCREGASFVIDSPPKRRRLLVRARQGSPPHTRRRLEAFARGKGGGHDPRWGSHDLGQRHTSPPTAKTVVGAGRADVSLHSVPRGRVAGVPEPFMYGPIARLRLYDASLRMFGV